MKTMRKALALLLVLTMMLALGIPAIADESEDTEVLHYVSLGASNSNGYALHGYLTEECMQIPF